MKLLYVLEEDNITPESKYWYLTKLAAKCTAKRMVPDYISEKVMKEQKINGNGDGDCYPCMGCRSFLTPDQTGNGWNNLARAKDYDGSPKYYGRFNMGVITINLPDVALSSGGDFDKFWELMEERTELIHKGLRIRVGRIANATSDVAPILWQYGALARLPKGASLKPLTENNYSTISLGYAGVYEMTKYMTGESHTSEKGKEFALQVMQFLNDKCAQWRGEEGLGYSLYGSPIESTTYKFASTLKKRFGEIPGITDHDYITNSYHVNVKEEIDAFEKIDVESQFQALSPGGAISYIEAANMDNNIDALLAVIQHIYNNIMYCEINTKSDFCQVCGSSGEIEIKGEPGHLYWECPVCGNRDQNKMNVARRTCGLTYIGSHKII